MQILKGLQGTLFGRNATGGAVLYQSVRPDKNKFGGYLTLDHDALTIKPDHSLAADQ